MHETQRASARNSGLPDLLATLAADCSNARPNRPGAKPSKLRPTPAPGACRSEMCWFLEVTSKLRSIGDT
jgi:hypothetical protein